MALAVDVAVVVLFVALGRGSHEEGEAVTGTLRVAAPFLLALGAGWLAGTRWWRRPVDVWFGGWLWAWTLVGGMVVRRVVFDRGTALAFVIVAAIFLSAFLVGWRALAERLVPAVRRH
ncbi:MAG: hypothetical protein JWL70_1176 [Acidimicrobiia bacterium]|nr:hypothetical protein [Acidimicrobiia bacterium]